MNSQRSNSSRLGTCCLCCLAIPILFLGALFFMSYGFYIPGGSFTLKLLAFFFVGLVLLYFFSLFARGGIKTLKFGNKNKNQNQHYPPQYQSYSPQQPYHQPPRNNSSSTHKFNSNSTMHHRPSYNKKNIQKSEPNSVIESRPKEVRKEETNNNQIKVLDFEIKKNNMENIEKDEEQIGLKQKEAAKKESKKKGLEAKNGKNEDIIQEKKENQKQLEKSYIKEKTTIEKLHKAKNIQENKGNKEEYQEKSKKIKQKIFIEETGDLKKLVGIESKLKNFVKNKLENELGAIISLKSHQINPYFSNFINQNLQIILEINYGDKYDFSDFVEKYLARKMFSETLMMRKDIMNVMKKFEKDDGNPYSGAPENVIRDLLSSDIGEIIENYVNLK